LKKSPASKGFCVLIRLQNCQRALGMEPIMELSGPESPRSHSQQRGPTR
jgi:hypothetical protein